ncbi:hypothetical protein [Maribacter flavus]|uniref:Lipocalin-like domain-containing protein n=1 Tax=Maribacter flavus TaxID=1658664 RepID=A0A5B2TNU0_9FLAO|nr:hypothetical protein [Maribacter flavus]KAA2215753.1 hypothetical protein F0361_16290 [Maribacter flavus]
MDRAKALLGQWKYAAITTDRAVDINGDGIVNIDLYNTQEMQQCLKDNITSFSERGENQKGSYSLNENSLPCSEDSEFTNVEQDNYELINDNSIIRFDNRNEMRIVEMTKERFVVDTDDVLGGKSVIVTITYVK